MFDGFKPHTGVSTNNINSHGSTGLDNPNHTDLVVSVIRSFAPDAILYSATNTASYSEMEAIEWLLDQGVNIINSSRSIGQYAIGDNPILNYYNSMTLWLEHICFNHDVHFVVATGNYGSEGVQSGALAYNVISVGNIDRNGNNNYNGYLVSQSSSYNVGYYNSGSGIPDKPDISAPGVELSITVGNTTHTGNTGTSFSTPQIAGVVALLCEQRTGLKTRQDAVKAILAASINFSCDLYGVTGQLYAQPNAQLTLQQQYHSVGAGLLDAYGACWVTKNWRYQASSISSSSYKTYTFNVSSSDTRIRVALSFLKYVKFGDDACHTGTNPTECSLNNLDLKVYLPNGTEIAHSTTTYNNLEIVDFPVNTAGTYTIKIERVGTVDGTIYYGVAWR
ncbi:MAG: S8 family serine peptidase [Clostridia bacterium]|nr:S8 family serine peptidase [Clostridia bacterium]